MTRHEFAAVHSRHHARKIANESRDNDKALNAHVQQLFLGIAAIVRSNEIDIGYAANDGTYSVDFAVHTLSLSSTDKNVIAKQVAEHIVKQVSQYEYDKICKFVAAGVAISLAESICPQLPSVIWAELDICPFILKPSFKYPQNIALEDIRPDEQADSLARKAVVLTGPTLNPRVDIGFRNIVEVDAGGHVALTTLEQYKNTVSAGTWQTVNHFAQQLRERKVSFAFFSATPQGGGVALMRHALIRFLRLLNVDCRWYVPRVRPEIFRITKTNHNILQGVNKPGERLTDEQAHMMNEWIEDSANRLWLPKGGPLSSRKDGGVDVIIIDDPQMPHLIPLAKQADPERLVIYRSHIQIESALLKDPHSTASEVWKHLWQDIKQADMFISHPVKTFVPANVPSEMVGWLPATTDWLDGLNKHLNDWSLYFRIRSYNLEAQSQDIPTLNFPTRPYIVQIARFDPSKGIPNLLAAYAVLRRKHYKDVIEKETPQLVIAGHGSIDDPDGTMVYDEILELLEKDYEDIRECISVLRLGPSDQQLNALLSGAKVATQLSTKEGFEVKVSEALHKGIPVVVSRAGGIPLQVQDGKNGFIVEPSDPEEIASKLYQLFTDQELYSRMSEYAKHSYSDEVSTVGNAASWLYLASELSKGNHVKPKGRWINDLAREAAGQPYTEGEPRLPRNGSLQL